MKTFKLFFCFIMILKVGISQEDYNMGLKKYYTRELQTAIDYFSKSILKNEKVALSYMYRGAAKSFLGNFDESFKDLNHSYSIDSLSDKINYYFGKAYFLNKQYGLAIENFKRSIKRNNNDPERFDGLAVAEMSVGNFSEALKNEDYAIRLDSSQSDYFINRGFVKLKLYQFDNAIADYNKALSIEKDYKAFYGRATAYFGLKKYENAIDDYNASLLMYAENAEALYFRGLTFENLGKVKEACNDFKYSASLGFTEASKKICK